MNTLSKLLFYSSFIAFPDRLPAQTGVALGFSNTGLSSLKYAGAEFLSNGNFQVERILLSDASGTVTTANLNANVTMDQQHQTLTMSYNWGSVKVLYAATGSRLDLTITTSNTSTSTITGLAYDPVVFKFPAKVQEYDGSIPLVDANWGAPTVQSMSFGTSVMVYANLDPSKTLMSGFPWALDRPTNTVFPLRVNTGKEDMYPDFYPVISRPISPGGSDVYQLSLRFGPVGSTALSLAGDAYQKFAATFPARLNWSDRRAVGSLIIATSAAGWKTNPRGWLLDPSIDVTTPAGLADFRGRILQWAANSVQILKSMNAQGMITWDIEGEQFPHATTYLCDPRVFVTAAPEMANVADDYFKTFRDAGLRVGVCVRPQQLVIAPDGQSATQQDVANPAQVLIDKITYAKNRWGATLFYVDSNGGPNNPMDPTVFQTVQAAFPDILLVPEHKNLQYYAYTAPYLQLNQGYSSSPPLARTVYPNAFSLINTADGPISQQFNTLVQSVSQGDALLFRGWFDDPGNAQVQSIYNTAKPPARDTTPPTVTITSPANGSTVSNTITIAASASDNVGVAGVQFRVDGNSLGAELTTAPYTAYLGTNNLSNGTHSVTATARDAAGNTATAGVSINVNNVVVDKTPPVVSIGAPASGATVSGSITVSANASDNVGVTGVQFQIDGASLGAAFTAPPYLVSVNTNSLSNGIHSMTAIARDAAGNTATAAISINVNNVVADKIPPAVSISAPANGATVSGSITVTANASDNVGVAGVQFQIDGANTGTEVAALPYLLKIDSTKLSNGPHTFTAIARDTAGNKAGSSVSVIVSNAQTLSCAVPGTDTFVGCYYSGTDFSQLKLVRADPQIDFNWGVSAPAPGVPQDKFSVRWQGSFAFTARTYTFNAATDDGFRAYIDGKLIYDYWSDHGANPVSFTARLTGGRHVIRMDYYQAGDAASAQLSWK